MAFSLPYKACGFYHEVGALTKSGAPGREPAITRGLSEPTR